MYPCLDLIKINSLLKEFFIKFIKYLILISVFNFPFIVKAQKLIQQDEDLFSEIRKNYGPYSQSQIEDVWKEISLRFEKNLPLFAENKEWADKIIAYDGTIFTNHEKIWGDLEAGLRARIKYPTYIQALLAAYKHHLEPEIDRINSLSAYFKDKNHLQEYIENWIYTFCFFFGSKVFQADELLSDDLILKTQLELTPSLQNAFHLFFKDLSDFHAQLKYKPKIGIPKKILILSSSGAGGGHMSTGKTIESYLRSLGYEVSFLDTRLLKSKDFRKDDIFMQFTGQMHSEDIFNEILQKRNDINRAGIYWEILSRLRNYIPDYSIENLVDAIKEFDPDLIISCLHHRPEYVAISYLLDIPQFIISTDYSLQSNLDRFVRNGDSKLIKILTAQKNENFFSETYQRLKGLIQFDTRYQSVAYLYNSLTDYFQREIIWSEFKTRFPILEFMGIPVSPKIQFEFSKSFLQGIKSLYHIPYNESVISIAMGAQGGSQLNEIIDNLIKNENLIAEKLHVLVICGKNMHLCDSLRKKTSFANLNKIAFQILGSQTQRQMSDIYNISKLIISKPGGLTTAELLTTKTPLIAYKYYSWEKMNLEELRQHDLGYMIAFDDELVPLINKILKLEKPTFRSENSHWSILLKKFVEDRFSINDHSSTANESKESKSEEAIQQIPNLNIAIDLGQRKAALNEKETLKTIDKPFISQYKPHIFFIFVDTLRQSSIKKETMGYYNFAKQSLQTKYSVASATATHHSTFSMFFSRLAAERTELLNQKWQMGSPYLRILRDKLGYNINLFGLTHLLWKMSDDPLEAYNLKTDMSHFYLSEESSLLLNFSSGSNALVDYAESDHKTNWYTARNGWNKRAEGDWNTIEDFKHFVDSGSLNKPSFNFIYFFAVHDPYNWTDDLWKHAKVNIPFAPNVDWWDQDIDTSINNRLQIRNSYENAVKGNDYYFSHLIKYLRSKKMPSGRSLYDESLIVFVSDHGEYLWELDNYHTQNKPWRQSFGHGGDGFSYVSDVPINFKLPIGQTHTKSATISDHTDIMPTIFDALKVSPKDYLNFSVGESLNKENRKECKITVNPKMQNKEDTMVFNNGREKAFVKLLYVEDPMKATGLSLRFFTDLNDKILSVDSNKEKVISSFKEDFKDCISTLF